MAYDHATAQRIRRVLAQGEQEVVEKQMFGGLCFMVGGHMCCGLTTEALMLRVGKAAYPDVLDLPHARPMTFTGRPLAGFVYVDPAGFRTARGLAAWLKRGTDFVATLPAKRPATDRPRPRPRPPGRGRRRAARVSS
ncbi:MAG: TfoX/Sxy family protein [Kofleriaceae bacterium]